MKKFLLLCAGLSFFSLLKSSEKKPKHFGAQEESPEDALTTAIDLHNRGEEVPVDIPEDPEPMARDIKETKARKRAFTLSPIGNLGNQSLAARRRAKSVGAKPTV